MNQELQILEKRKNALKERIKFAEIADDSYYLSSLCKEHQRELFEVERQILNLQKEQNS